MLIDVMGHNAGWLALGASLAAGADVCLIPEIPYHLDRIVDTLEERRQKGRRFSLIAVAEGARPAGAPRKPKSSKRSPKSFPIPASVRLAPQLEKALDMETRTTTLGHIQRGGIPTPTDRILATELGVAAAQLIAEGRYGVMVAVKGDKMVPVPLQKVAGKKKLVPLDHPMIRTARLIGLCLGD